MTLILKPMKAARLMTGLVLLGSALAPYASAWKLCVCYGGACLCYISQ